MNKNEKGKELSREFWIAVIAVCSLMIVLITIGIIVFVNRDPEIVEKEENGGNVTLNYSTSTKGLTLLNATPTVNEVGEKNMIEGQYFDFSVDVDLDGADKVEYEISIIKDENSSNISDDDIRIYLEKEDSGTYVKLFGPEKYKASKNYSSTGSEIGSMVLANVKKIKSGTDNYRLRIWLSDSATSVGGSYSVEVDIHAVAK